MKIVPTPDHQVAIVNDAGEQMFDSLDGTPCLYYTFATAEYMLGRLQDQGRLVTSDNAVV